MNMTGKVVRLTSIGIAGAIVVAIFAYWKGRPDSPSDPPSVSAGVEHPLVTPEVKKPEIAADYPDVNAAEPFTSVQTKLPIKTARPDAGYYDHPSRPYGVAGLLFFTNTLAVSAQDTPAALHKIFEVTQVDDETAREFLDYMQNAKRALDEYERETIGQLCNQRDELRTIPQFASALDSIDVAVESRRAELTRGSESVLGEVGMRSFEMYIANKDRGKRTVARDNEETLRSLNKSPAELLLVYCNRR
jgi:hypothetical protein